MHPARLAARGMAAHAPLFAAMGALVLVLTALLTGIPRYLDAASTASAREALDSAAPVDAAMRAHVRLAADAEAQSAAMTAALGPLLSGVAAEALRSVQSDPVSVVLPEGREASIRLLADPDAAARISLSDGSWPGDGIALPSAVADELGVGVGDRLLLGERELEVTALWSPTDPSDPAWFGDAAGAALVDEATLAGLDLNPFAVWTLVPRIDGLDASRIDALGDAARGWEAAIRADDELSRGGVIFSGGLASTVTTIERGLASARGVSPLPLVVVGVIGTVAFLQLTRLLIGMRSAESLLLRARGRSPRAAGLGAAAEVAVATAPGGALGALLAVLLVPGPPIGTGAIPALIVVASAIALAGALSVAAARSVRAPERAALGGYIGVVVLTAVAAGVALWQFRLYGSPVITTADGETAVDPLAVLAAPLGLLTLSLLAVVLLPLGVGGAERIAARGSRLAPALVTRQLSRRPAEFAVPLVLTALAVASAVLASSYSATWTDLAERAGELRNGAPLRIQLSTPASVGGATTIASSPPFSVEGASAAPVLVAATEAGDDDVSLVAISASDLGVVTSLGGSLDRVALATALSAAPAGIELDVSASRVALRVAAAAEPLEPAAPLAPEQGDVALTVWVRDAQGALARLPLEDDGSGIRSAVLPVGAAPWSIAAIDTAVTTGPTAARYSVAIDVDGAATPDDWEVQREAGSAADRATGLGFVLSATGRAAVPPVRLMPPSTGVPAVAISAAFADRLGLEAGNPVRLRFAGSGLMMDGSVAAVVDQVPGSGSELSALVDLRTFHDAMLRVTSSVPAPDQVWIRAEDGRTAETATALLTTLPPGATLTTVDSGSGRELQRPLLVALWIGAAGSLVLAAAATAAVAAALVRSRSGETTVLRALGVHNRTQARARAVELAVVLVLGAAVGIIAGLAVAGLTVADLARSAVLDAPRTLPAPVRLDLPALAASLGLLAALALAVIGSTAARVIRAAARSTGREVEP